jgi:Sodium/hydrogen exchanger family
MFEWILVLLLAAVILTNLAERLAVPYPSLLAIVGAGLAFLPFAPQIRIEPELTLALFVAPALLDAAFDTSPRDLRRNAIPCVVGRDRGPVDDGGGRVSRMALCRFADRRGDRPGCDRGTTRCARRPGIYAAAIIAAASFPGRWRRRTRSLPRARHRHAGGARQRRRRDVHCCASRYGCYWRCLLEEAA